MSVHPTEIKLHQQSHVLEITFGDDENYLLPYEFLRVYSPSAEVRGHGVGQGTLQVGKKNVGVREVLPVGNYAMKIVFDDGHDSGLYSWDYLYNLGKHQADLWQEYLAQLAVVGGSREPGSQPEIKKSGCGSGCGHA